MLLEDDEPDQEGPDDHEAVEEDEGEEAQDSGPSGAAGGIYVRSLVWDPPSTLPPPLYTSAPALGNSVSRSKCRLKSTGTPGCASSTAQEGDLEILDSLSISDKPKRAAHKFQKKAARSKGTRGQDKSTGADGVGAVMYGKKGGLVRPTGSY